MKGIDGEIAHQYYAHSSSEEEVAIFICPLN